MIVLTDAECLAAWRAATRVGADGPDGKADAVAVAIVRLVLALDDEWSFPLWICNALGIGGNNADKEPQAVLRCCADIRMAARGVREARSTLDHPARPEPTSIPSGGVLRRP